MAQVYQAHDLYLHRLVALKIINPLSALDDLNKERFLQEIKAVARIRHPNVILVYDVFIDKKDWCLVFELLEGKTLKEYLNNIGVLEMNETINIMKQVLKGVNACHQVGIIHRDLKPDNIIFTFNGAIKVLDFGIAIIDDYEVKKHAHQVIGTMKYIAPEVVKFQKSTIQSDIYALGIILYELLSGKPPFFHKNPQILASKHLKEPMPLIRDINQNIPQSLENVIMKATNKNLKLRYQNILEFENDLETCLDARRKNEKPIIKKQALFFQNQQKWKMTRAPLQQPFYLKRWFLWTLVMMIIIISIIVIILLLWY